MLGKHRCLHCGLCQSILTKRYSSFWRTREAKDDQFISACNIIFLYRHLGVALEEGAYSRDKMSDLAYKPPLHFRLALRLQLKIYPTKHCFGNRSSVSANRNQPFLPTHLMMRLLLLTLHAKATMPPPPPPHFVYTLAVMYQIVETNQ